MPPIEKPRHVIYLSRTVEQDPEYNQQAVFIYDSVAMTKRALNLILADDSLLWKGPNKCTSSTGIVVEIRPCRTTTHTLEDIIAHEFTVAQLGVSIQPHLAREAKQFRYGRQPDTVEPRAARERASRPLSRAPRDGMVPAADIAAFFEMEARDLRALFRRAGVEKPKAGWAWAPAEVDAIKAKVAELIAEES